jgi:hypothetical protein
LRGASFDKPVNEMESHRKMAPADTEYFEERAEAEIALAQRAQDSRVVQAHYELANAYLDMIYGEPSPSEA